MSKSIAIVDDEKDLVELLSVNLKKSNFKTAGFYDAASFLDSLKKHIPDLVLLDLMLPDIDGIEVCKTLRSNDEYKNIPIIILTAKQDETDKIIGLEIGADDYMTKPFSPRELVARVKALLRRSSFSEKEPEERKVISIDDLIFIDTAKHEVHDKNNDKIFLTTTEFNLLLILNEKRGWVFSREKLLNKLWGEDKYVIDRTIDVHIKNLREKLKDAGKLIKNIRGVGYKLDYEE